MLIRLQERVKLINFDKVCYTEIDGWNGTTQELQGFAIQMYFDKKVHENTGIYSSEAKALKVLDMIQDYYTNTINSRCRVFQMPQDSEVEA